MRHAAEQPIPKPLRKPYSQFRKPYNFEPGFNLKVETEKMLLNLPTVGIKLFMIVLYVHTAKGISNQACKLRNRTLKTNQSAC